MNKQCFIELKNIVDFGDAYFVEENGDVKNIRSVFACPDGRIYFSSEPANLAVEPVRR